VSLIQLAGIARVFHLGDSVVHALNGLDVSIEPGEYVAIMGPSGSGKSTLLNLLGLLDRPDAGSYRLEGRDVTTLSPDEQAAVRSLRIGFVFQSFHLVPRLTAAENVALPMMLAGIPAAERTPSGCAGAQGFRPRPARRPPPRPAFRRPAAARRDRPRHHHAAGRAARRRAHRQPRPRHRRRRHQPARSAQPARHDADRRHPRPEDRRSRPAPVDDGRRRAAARQRAAGALRQADPEPCAPPTSCVSPAMRRPAIRCAPSFRCWRWPSASPPWWC
jgi:ABC-type sugar transport system ATPase subunit